MLLGVIISAVLYGVCLLQALIYFISKNSSSYHMIIGTRSNLLQNTGGIHGF